MTFLFRFVDLFNFYTSYKKDQNRDNKFQKNCYARKIELKYRINYLR